MSPLYRRLHAANSSSPECPAFLELQQAGTTSSPGIEYLDPSTAVARIARASGAGYDSGVPVRQAFQDLLMAPVRYVYPASWAVAIMSGSSGLRSWTKATTLGLGTACALLRGQGRAGGPRRTPRHVHSARTPPRPGLGTGRRCATSDDPPRPTDRWSRPSAEGAPKTNGKAIAVAMAGDPNDCSAGNCQTSSTWPGGHRLPSLLEPLIARPVPNPPETAPCRRYGARHGANQEPVESSH